MTRFLRLLFCLFTGHKWATVFDGTSEYTACDRCEAVVRGGA